MTRPRAFLCLLLALRLFARFLGRSGTLLFALSTLFCEGLLLLPFTLLLGLFFRALFCNPRQLHVRPQHTWNTHRPRL